MSGTVLAIEHLTAGYEDAAVLRDLDLSVGEGEVVALLGANGAGKTTTLRAVSGVVHPMEGRIVLDGQDLAGASISARARRGIAHVPENRGVFFGLTVAEHFRLGHRTERLDEPAAGLDTSESEELGRQLRVLANRGHSMLLIDHDMGFVLSVCDRIYVLEFGKMIASGPPDAVRKDQKVITAYLGSAAAELAT